MTFTLLFGYLIGWVITTIGVAVIIGKLNEPVRPQRYVIPLTVAAGVAWPLVILGAAQMAILVLVMEATRHRTRRSRPPASAQVDELPNELLTPSGRPSCNRKRTARNSCSARVGGGARRYDGFIRPRVEHPVRDVPGALTLIPDVGRATEGSPDEHLTVNEAGDDDFRTVANRA